MPQFVTPLPLSSTSQHARSASLRDRTSATRRRKRKHASPDTDSESSPDSSSEDEPPDPSTNPLSLTPDEVAQYRLAGLSLNEHLPSSKGWPHKGQSFLARRKRRGGTENEKRPQLSEDGAETEAEHGVGVEENAPRLRSQHLSVLVAILHRCLLEGDIQRAARAWALLLRVQVGGKPMDIRGTGYWGIGAELLVRSMDQHHGSEKTRRKFTYDSDSDPDLDSEISLRDKTKKQIFTDDPGTEAEEDHQQIAEERWGTAAGLQLAKDYYERLILEYPYKQRFSHNISAIDFWPCMISCEIYGIQYEQQAALRRLQSIEEQDIDDFIEDELSDEGGADHLFGSSDDDGNVDAFEAAARRRESKQRRKDEYLFTRREEIRNVALTATIQVATRLEERMTAPPYIDSHDLLHLKGMIALYVGDLCVPDRPREEDALDNLDAGTLLRNGREVGGGREAQRRNVIRTREMAYRKGMEAREREWDKARTCFSMLKSRGGDVSLVPDGFLSDDETKEEEEEEKKRYPND